MKSKKIDFIPPRQRKAINLLVSGKAKTKAAALRSVGYAENTIRGFGMVNYPKFNDALMRAYKVAGLTEQRTANLISEAYEAKKRERGAGDSYEDVSDHFVRLKAAETYLKSTGRLYPAPQEQPNLNVGVFVVPEKSSTNLGWENQAKIIDVQKNNSSNKSTKD